MNATRLRLSLTLAVLALAALVSCSVVPPMPRAATRDFEQRLTAVADDYVAALSAADSTFRVELARARATWKDRPVAVAAIDATEQYWRSALQRAAELRMVQTPVGYARRIRDERLRATDELRATVEAEVAAAEPPGDLDELPGDVADLIGIEERAFAAHLREQLKDEFVTAQLVRSDLFRRKYFADDPEHRGNWVEGLINGHLWPFCSDDLGTVDAPGVSPWEALARVEPAITVGDSEQQLVLGSLGVVHHFFPSYKPSGYDTNPQDGFWTDVVQRIGLRVAAGAAVSDTGGADLVIGAGLQVRSFTIWGIWNGEQDDYTIAIGVNDLTFLRDTLPLFGM